MIARLVAPLLLVLSFCAPLNAEERDGKEVSLAQKVSDLEKTVAALRTDNAALREQLAKSVATKPAPRLATTATSPTAPTATATAPADDAAGAFWISATGKRHNTNCRYFGTGKGHPGGANDGVPCKICGG